MALGFTYLGAVPEPGDYFGKGSAMNARRQVSAIIQFRDHPIWILYIEIQTRKAAAVTNLLSSLLILVTFTFAGFSYGDERTGESHLTFTERCPASSTREYLRHYSMTGVMITNLKDYNLPEESFEVWVPPSYKPDEGWGLFVFVSAGGSGRLHRDWAEQLEKHKLLWIGANNAGNDRMPFVRIGLAIDGQFNMKKQYSIDEKRIFIGGVSGGGRVSSMVGIAYPDIFTGGIYMVGCNWYRDMPATTEPGKFWHRTFNAPPYVLLRKAKENSRHVLLTGEHDMNGPQTKVNYEKGFKPDGYKHVIYLEVPGMGHQPPPAEWFGKALDFLDAKDEPAPAKKPAIKGP